jgi:hypothetical protein
MEILEIKDVNIDIEKFNIENFESIVDKKINKEMVKEFSKLENRDKIKDLMMLREIPKIKKVEKMKSNLREKNKILKRYNIYNNWFFTEYLNKLYLFLKKIQKTIKFIKSLSYSEQINIIVLTDFIFFLSFFNFESQQINNYINYYENTFEEPDYLNNKNILINKNNNQIIIKKRKIIIDNYEDYNLTLTQLEDIEKNRYLREHNIKFNKFQEKNLFTKYRILYLDLFKKILLNDNSIIKKLFLNTFPVLKNNYFINDTLLEYIFNNKIFVFNLNNLDFVGLTDHLNMNIFIKGNYVGNIDSIENEICYFAAFVIILIHELSHFIRIYVYKHLKLSEYEHSFIFEDNEKAEIGKFIEKKLFGKVIEKIDVTEAIYILNISNYFKNNDEEFSKGFIDLKQKKINGINDIDINVQEFFKMSNIDIKKLNFSKIDNKFIIKGNSNCLNIGINNDKCATLEEYNRLFESLSKIYKDIFQKDKKV